MTTSPSPNSEQISAQLTRWYRHASRRVFVRRIRSTAQQWLAESFGYYALEMSSFNHDEDWFDNNIRSSFRIGTQNPSLESSFEQLPIDSESMDLVIMNHVVEFSEKPDELFAEADRILVPEGKLMIVAFNSMGFQGLIKPFLHRRGAPWCGHFYSVHRLQGRLAVAGFDIEHFRYAVAPFFSYNKNLWWLSQRLEKYIPWSCSLSLVYATKRVSSVRLISRSWKKRGTKEQVIQPT